MKNPEDAVTFAREKAIPQLEQLSGFRGLTMSCDRAPLLGAGRLAVDGTSVSARRIVIATGTRPAVPPVEGLDPPEVSASSSPTARPWMPTVCLWRPGAVLTPRAWAWRKPA